MENSNSPPERSDSIQAVLFDVGGVLLQLDYREAFRELGLGANAETQAAMTTLGNDPDYDAFERGWIGEEDYRRRLATKLGRDVPPERFRALWNGIVGEPFEGIVELVAGLRTRVPVYALTNSNATHVESVLARFPWLVELDGFFSSHQLGARKPEPVAFERALERMGVTARHVLYLDDREENVAAAATVGMHACWVRRSPEDVRHAVRGILR
jgi:putative hydrolase of the HAD superfamily